MKVTYRSSKLEKTLTDHSKLQRRYGKEASRRIIQRLQELDAAERMSDLPPSTRPHPHQPRHREIFSVDIQKHQHSTRLLFSPAGTYDIEDYRTVTEIQIEDIIKIHS